MSQGIYCLYYETNDSYYYIGKSVNIEDRITKHYNQLVKGDHHNSTLQYLYNKYRHLPTMHVIHSCTENLDTLEIEYIRRFSNTCNIMNETIGGEGAAEGEDNAFALYDKDTYLLIATMLACTDMTHREIAKELSVSDRVVGTISSGKQHKWIEKEIPEIYVKLLEKVGNRNTMLFSNNVYERIFKRLVFTEDRVTDIANEESISHRIVERISLGQSHLDLKVKFPEEYGILLSKINNRRVKAARLAPYPEVVSPDGIVYSFENARAFARSHNLQQSNLTALVNGKIKSHKGWTLVK